MIKLFAKMNPLHRAIARFLVMGGGGGGEAYRKCQRHEPCRGSVSSPMKMANNYCKSLQSKQLSLTRTNPSTDLICLAQLFQGGGGATAPLPPPLLATALSHQVSLFILTVLKLAYTP